MAPIFPSSSTSSATAANSVAVAPLSAEATAFGSSLHKKLYFSFNNGNVFCIELYPTTTTSELNQILLSECDGTTAEKAIKLSKKDGSLLPISASLPANTKAEPYIISLKPSSSNVSSGNNQRLASDSQGPTPGSVIADDMEKMSPDIVKNLSTAVAKIEDFSTRITNLPDVTTTLRQLQDIGRQFDTIEAFYSALEKKYPDLQCGISPISKFVRKSARVDHAVFSGSDTTVNDELRNQLKQAVFNNWRWAENQMTSMMEHMFSEWGLLKKFNIDLLTIRRFLLTVKENYNPNPFHNFRHAFCVTQMFYGMVSETGLHKRLKEIDLFTGLVSCIVHDVDHPGFNNAYQINARTDLAILYNDQSPLENHHCSLAFSILRLPDCNLFKNLDRKDFDYVRRGIIRCVLSTDMSKHAEIMAKFNICADKFNIEDQDHRDTLIVMLVKCSDISNEARPPNVSEPWLDCLLEEYFMQSDREKAEGLPVAPFMDRDKVTKPSAQIGFIEFVMLPMFNSIARVLPQLKSTVISQIGKSLIYYKQLMEEQKLQQLQAQQLKQQQEQKPSPKPEATNTTPPKN